jgi:heptosyltransferase-2
VHAKSILRKVNAAAERALAMLAPSAAPCRPRPVPFVRRLLIVKLVGMGDAVLIRSLVHHLQGAHPHLEIGALAGPATREIFATIPRVRLHPYDPAGADVGIRRAAAKLSEIRAARYDAVIDFEQHLVLVAVFLGLTRIATRIGLAAANHPRSRFQTHTVPLSGDDLMWDAYASLMRVIAPALPNPSAVPLPVSAAAAADVRSWWRDHGLSQSTRVVALHLGCGSTSVARRWPVSRFVDLANDLRARRRADAFVLTGRAEEAALAGAFLGAFSGPVVSTLTLPSLQHTAAVLQRCTLVVSNDTGVMHLAAAMGTPTIGLFGPNSPTRYAPIGPSAEAVYQTQSGCSPCIHIHRGVAPECVNPVPGQCLRDINIRDVLKAADRLIHADRLRPMTHGRY